VHRIAFTGIACDVVRVSNKKPIRHGLGVEPKAAIGVDQAADLVVSPDG
jgi:hypothetical protein